MKSISNKSAALRAAQCCALLAVPAVAFSSSKGVDYYAASQLQTDARALVTNAAAGAKSPFVKPLEKYGHEYTLLVRRNTSGQVELHEHESDLYLVVEGEATLASGGTMNGKKQKSEGEYVGDSLTGGDEQVLRKGDVVHVAPNLPHQLKLKPGGTFSYFVLKVKEQ